MATFGDSYQGNQDKAAGVLGLMQVVLSDLAREESEVKMAEAGSADSHAKFVQQTKVALAKKNTAISLKGRDADSAKADAADAKASLSGVKKQLKAADEEYQVGKQLDEESQVGTSAGPSWFSCVGPGVLCRGPGVANEDPDTSIPQQR